MALLVQPCFFSGAAYPKRPVSVSARRGRIRFSASAMDMKGESGARSIGSTAIVWYKHDLRVEDHPGLVGASEHGCVVPLYIFDHRILSRFSDEMLELLLFALEDLKSSLKGQGSNLMMRIGNTENVLAEIVKEVQASSIFLEEEVEYELCVLLDIIKEAFSGESPKFEIWRTPFYDYKSLADLPSSFHDFKRLNLPVVCPLVPPQLPGNTMNLSWGTLPTLVDLKQYIDGASSGGNVKREWTSLKSLSAEKMLQMKNLRRNLNSTLEELEEGNQRNLESKARQRKKSEKSAFITSQGSLVGGGSDLVLNALGAYLRYLEGTARDDWQEVHEKLREAEQREGSSFQTLFGSALRLGIISRRRAYAEAIKYEKERNAGFLSPFGYSTVSVAAVINTVSSMEWYWLLSLKSQNKNTAKFPIRIWQWNNHLIQYMVTGHEGPAILLVHGFGAFLEHYRDNVYSLAEAGNRVWTLTLLGFGKSEKPNIIYTELVWAELLRDFIIEVVGEPVHLVGNSIGGYSVAIAAGLWSSVVKSVVLLNTAGNFVPGYSALRYSEDRQISGLTRLGARLLLAYLRFNIRNILKSFYPSKPDRADDWLMNEMIRASHDPGVVFVLESIFSLDLSLPLNCLLEGFDKKMLVVQGMKDPLSDSKSKLAMFRDYFTGVTIKEIDAGHCPHDELPSEVNSIIKKWVVSLEGEVTPLISDMLTI